LAARIAARATAGQGGVDRREPAAQLGALGRPGALGEGAPGRCLKHLAHLAKGERVGLGDRGVDRPALGHHRHQSLGLQLPQRLADDRATDAVPVAERALHQPLTGGEVRRDDRRAEQLHHLLVNESSERS
jgi:hypothetical protein